MMRNSRRDNKTVTLALVGGAFLLVVALSLIKPPAWLREGMYALTGPLLQRAAELSHEGFAAIGLASSYETLEEENRSLKAALEAVRLERMQQALLREENDMLHASLFGTTTSRIPATILVRPPQTLYDTLVLDVGNTDNVAVGNRIFVDTAVVGEIVRTNEHTSLALLYSSAGERVPAFVHASSTYPTTVYGLGGQSMLAEVPKGAVVEEGTLLTLRDDSTHLLGIVESVESDEQDSVITLRFASPVNVSIRTNVFVEVGRNQPVELQVKER